MVGTEGLSKMISLGATAFLGDCKAGTDTSQQIGDMACFWFWLLDLPAITQFTKRLLFKDRNHLADQ